MQKNQKSTSHAKAFIDYKPAELKIGTQWLIVYYAKNPISLKMERFRISVPVLKNKTERIKYAKKIILELNKKLDNGWLPYYSEVSSNEFKSFKFCTSQFLEQTKKEVEKGTKRSDTLRAYTSYLSMIDKYILEKNIKINLILEFNQAFVVNYLDWIFFERKNSPRTYNNHLGFIGGFIYYCNSRGWLSNNFITSIPKKRNEPKKRQILSITIKNKIRELEHENFNYYVLCMATYFCFLRRTELTKLKVDAVNLNGNYITIDEKISKNRKTENVTIPSAFFDLLKKHLENCKADDYLFSENFSPGRKLLNPKKISDEWERFRKRNDIANEFQFYSLKDTGITDLLNAGVPAIKVRDQARHHDLKITESYTYRNNTFDEVVKNANLIF